MYTKKIILTALALSGIATVSAFTFAANTSTGSTENIKTGIQKMFNHERGSRFHGDGELMGRLIDYKNLTQEQKTAIDNIQKDYLNNLKPYVSTGNQEKLQKMIDNVGKIPEIMTGEFEKGDYGMGKSENGPRGKHGKGGMNPLYMFINFDSLTEEQKISLKSLQDGNMTKTKEIFDKIKNSSSEEEKISLETQLKSLHKSFLESIKVYVSQDKITEYEEFLNKHSEK